MLYEINDYLENASDNTFNKVYEYMNKKLKIAVEALENIKNKDNTLCPYCNEGQYHSWIAEEALEAIKDMGK